MSKTLATCECSDPLCVDCNGDCVKTATSIIRRIDMDSGDTIFHFCDGCTTDALNSGVFSFEGELNNE